MNLTADTDITAPTSTPCVFCGRPLTSKHSIAHGSDPGCRDRIHAAARAVDLTDFTADQVERALQLLVDDAAITKLRPDVWRTVSTDGETTYLTTYALCTCPAGINDRLCYHRAAVLVLRVLDLGPK